jgi:hypothetical protein
MGGLCEIVSAQYPESHAYVLLMQKQAGIGFATDKTFEVCSAPGHSFRSRNLCE